MFAHKRKMNKKIIPQEGAGILSVWLAKERYKKISHQRVGKSILDVGCGLGNVLIFLNDYDRYVGLDRDEKLINYAKKRFSSLSPKVTFINCDVVKDEIPLSKNIKFDSIILSAFLEHIVKDRRKDVLKKLQTYLTEKGVIINITPTRKAKKLLELGSKLKLLRKESIEEHDQLLSSEEIFRLAKDAGLIVSSHDLFLFKLNSLTILRSFSM